MTSEIFIPGKNAVLETAIATMQKKLSARGLHLNESSRLHEVDGIWSIQMKDNECAMHQTLPAAYCKLFAADR